MLVFRQCSFGLLAFSYASLHFLTWLGLDLFFDWAAILEDIVERPFVTAGFTALISMLPLAITSTKRWIRRLGARRWTQLHRLAYLAGIAAVVHHYWGVKADILPPLLEAALLLLLFAGRFVRRRNQATAR